MKRRLLLPVLALVLFVGGLLAPAVRAGDRRDSSGPACGVIVAGLPDHILEKLENALPPDSRYAAEVESFTEMAAPVFTAASMTGVGRFVGQAGFFLIDALEARAQGESLSGSLVTAAKSAVFGGAAGKGIGKTLKAAKGAAKGGAKATKGLQKQLDEHLAKLNDYKANPDKFDNKGFLKGASPKRRQKIIEARIQKLEKQIENFRNQINQAGGGG